MQNKFFMLIRFEQMLLSYLKRQSIYLFICLFSERLGHLGVLKRSDGKLRNNMEKHGAVKSKRGYTLSLVLQTSDAEEEISASL